MKKRRIIVWCLLFAMLVEIIQPLSDVESYQAATSYTNAKEFYESTAKKGEKYHAETACGNIYYATQAKLASSSTNKKYYTVGFDITLSGSGHSLSFTVQREGGSMTEVNSQNDGTYEYVLYSIENATLYDLAIAADEAEAAYVLDTSTINVEMNAILVTKEGDTLGGSITEDGSGGFTQTGTIYRLKNSDDLKALKDIFTGHEFESYRKIKAPLDNYELQIRYAVNGTPEVSENSSTAVTVGSGYKLANRTFDGIKVPYVLHNSDKSLVISKGRILQQMTLLGTDGLGLSKTGYHLPSGREWVKADGTVFASGSTHMPKSIEPMVGTKDYSLNLYANWKPNTYTVKYDNNGGLGRVSNSIFTYDSPGKLRANNCIKEGYTLVPGAEWNTKPDGTGQSFGAEDYVANLVSEDGGSITLYANWQKAVYAIDTNKDGGSGGTDRFFEQYDNAWFSNPDLSNLISGISAPNKTGYQFKGYYTYYFGTGDPITDNLGKILVSPAYFTRNSIVYANYTPKTYSIFFDRQGGTGGLDSVTATYDKMVPFAGNSPIKNGYTFKGYFDKTSGKGTRYYNEFMSGEEVYQVDGNLTLFAYWLDETPPLVTLDATAVNFWTNTAGGIRITGEATDIGTGLDKVELYCGSTLVSSKTGLKGAQTYTLQYDHKTEGVYQYRIVAYDRSGKTAEAYVTVKYDSTAPTGTYTITNSNYSSFGINVTATDYKIP